MFTSTLNDRYPGLPGCRLDQGSLMEDTGHTGPAVDLGRVGTMGKYSLWVRESGTGDGKSATVALSADNIRSLRDGCTRLLLELGLEEEITIAIPKLAKSTRSQAENARSWAGSTPGLQD